MAASTKVTRETVASVRAVCDLSPAFAVPAPARLRPSRQRCNKSRSHGARRLRSLRPGFDLTPPRHFDSAGTRPSRVQSKHGPPPEPWIALCYSLVMADLHRDPVEGEIIDAAIKVHRTLGPGLLESSYEVCLHHELTSRRLLVERQVPVPIVYEGITLECGYRLDLLVEGDIVVAVKSIERLLPLHTMQVLTYLRLTGARQALLFNFNSVKLTDGLRSFQGNGKQSSLPPWVGRTPGERPFPRVPGLGGGPSRWK